MKPRFLLSLLAASITLVACSEPSAPDADSIPPDASLPAMFELSTETPKLPILTGTSGELHVALTRHAPFVDAVTITATNLPPGVTANPITLAPGETTGTLVLDAPTGTPHSLPTEVTLAGTSGASRTTTNATVTIYGAPGTVDTSFVGGKQVTPIGIADDYGYAMAVQPDGKLVIAGVAAEHGGDFALLRLERDGAIDQTFGDGGKVLTDFGGGSDIAYAIALQPDGKIIVAGNSTVTGSGIDFAIARYLPDGTLDTTFSGDGKVTSPVSVESDTIYSVVIQPDGKIVVGGESNRGSGTTGVDFAVGRYEPNGAVDVSFGTDGFALTAMKSNTGRDTILALALQQIGSETRILAAGGDGDFALARYRPNGALDTTFGTSGKLMGVFGSVTGSARALAVTPIGVFVAGHAEHQFAIIKISEAGVIDETFGRKKTQVVANDNEAQAIALDGNNLLVAGWASEPNSTSGNFALVRYLPTGQLDASFGSGGMVITQVATATKSDFARALVLQTDDRVPTVRAVAAGYANGSNNDFAVVRYWR